MSEATGLAGIRDWSLATEEKLTAGYEAMAADAGGERDALEWSEALLGECL